MGYKRKTRNELNASGISPEEREIDKLLEEIVEREMALEAEKEILIMKTTGECKQKKWQQMIDTGTNTEEKS